MDITGMTDMGKLRDNNEDYYLIPAHFLTVGIAYDANTYGQLMIVCDGLGGHNAGEVASKMAAKSLMHSWYGGVGAELEDKQRLETLIRLANQEVYRASRDNSVHKGMGTTLTALLVKDKHAFVANVGDSRAYLFQQGKLSQISRDHSYVQELYEDGQITKREMWTHPSRNLITEAIGLQDETKVDIYAPKLCAGDIILLCSDGLNDMLEDSSILKIMQQKLSLDELGENLIAEALDKGGLDNVTVVLARMPVPWVLDKLPELPINFQSSKNVSLDSLGKTNKSSATTV